MKNYIRLLISILIISCSSNLFAKDISLLECVKYKGHNDLSTVFELVLDCNDLGIVSSLAGVEKLPNLDYLDLDNNNIKNLWPIANHWSSRSDFKLWLGSNPITDYSPLGKLDYRYLSLLYTNIKDISFIGNMKNLKELDLSGNNISNIDSLYSLKYLTKVTLNRNNDILCSDIEKLKKNNSSLVVVIDKCKKSDSIPFDPDAFSSFNIINITGLGEGSSISIGEELFVNIKVIGNIDKVVVNWGDELSDTISVGSDKNISFSHIYKNTNLSNKKVNASITAYFASQEVKKVNGVIDIYDYREELNKSIVAQRIVEDGGSFSIYVMTDNLSNQDVKKVYFRYRTLGSTVWSSPIEINKISDDVFNLYLDNSSNLKGVYEYQVATDSRPLISFIYNVTFQESKNNNISQFLTEEKLLLYSYEKEAFSYLSDSQKSRYLYSRLNTKLLELIIPKYFVDLETIINEITEANNHLNLSESESSEVSELILDLIPYLQNGALKQETITGLDIVEDYEIYDFFNITTLDSDLMPVAGRIVRFIDKKEQIQKYVNVIPRIVSYIKTNRK